MWSVPTHLPRPPVPAQSSAPLGKHPWLCTGHRGTVAQSRPLKDTLMGAHLPPLLAGQGSRGSRKPAHCTQAQLHKDKGLGGGGVSNHTVSRGGCFRVRHHLWVPGPWLSAPACQEPPIPPPVASPLLSLRPPLHPPATRIACRPTPPSHVGTTASTRQCAPGSWLR